MNKLVVFLILFALAVTNPPETFAQKSGESRKDSLCITSSGHQNQVIINSKYVTQLTDCFDSLAIRGEVVQKGENNSIEINTEKKFQAANRKPQVENRNQLKRSGNPETSGKPVTCNKQPATRNMLKRSENPENSGQHITIRQSGNNNKIKLTTR